MVWKRNGVAIPNSQSTVSNDGLVYTSTLSLVAVSHVVDNGTYTCEVTTNSSHGYTSSTQLSNPLHLDIKGKCYMVLSYEWVCHSGLKSVSVFIIKGIHDY